MTHADPAVLETVTHWPEAAQATFWHVRTLCHSAADDADIGPLGESLKWGQPAWRPTRPRTGSTLRASWAPGVADRLMLYVDCKTDLAQRAQTLYPDAFDNDGRRALGVSLSAPLPEDAIAHLAQMTFTYHVVRR